MNNEPTPNQKIDWSFYWMLCAVLAAVFGIPTACILIAAWVISRMF